MSFIETRELSDLELVSFAKKGDNSAFGEIVRRHKSKVASTIFGMLGRCDEADDVGQEVFIRFYKSIANFRGDSALSTYLVRIAINLSINELNKRKRRFFSFDRIIEEGGDIADPKIGESYRESDELVQKAINKLNTKYKTVLVLRLIDGYSSEETAKILNIPLGTVLSRLRRAQIKLKEFLEPIKRDL